VAPLYGIPVDWPDLSARADRHGAMLIEDAAQGHGTLLHGRPLGSLGTVSVLSFGRGKGWTGSGGGALLWREPGPEPEADGAPSGVASVRAAALALAQAWLARPRLYWLPATLPGAGLGETRYRPPGPIRGMRSFQAALLLETERDADEEAHVRRTHGAELAAALAERPEAAVPVPPTGSTPGYLRFPVLVPGGAATLGAGDEAARLGVAPSYPMPLGHLPALRGRLVDAGVGWPGAERLARDLLTLPTHGLLSAGERQRVVELIASRRGLTAGAVP
jgi:dTDP-4-amino-4,6-dideoxygalactose transaminase